MASTALGGYAFAVEPMRLLRTTTYRPQLADWPDDLNLRVVIMADLHACNPWMSLKRIAGLVDKVNAMEPDIILLLGDYVSGMHVVTSFINSVDWARELGNLKAPLGVHAVLGNHDWWEDRSAQKRGSGPTIAGEAIKDVGINLMENDALKIEKDGKHFWLAGLGDQLAFLPRSKFKRWQGADDLDATLAQVKDDAPIILMAHEPDIFPKVPRRVSLTLSGHTHGGQFNLLGWTPVVPSRYGSRYAYGHIVEDERDLIVSGGLGCSIIPMRFGSPPELVVLELGQSRSA